MEWLLERGERGRAFRIAAALEKISQMHQDEHVLLPSQIHTRMLEGASYQVFNQFDFDLADMHFEQNKRMHGQHRDPARSRNELELCGQY